MSLTFGLYYDFRNPAPWREPWPDRYRAILEQIAWAEGELGFGSVWISDLRLRLVKIHAPPRSTNPPTASASGHWKWAGRAGTDRPRPAEELNPPGCCCAC